MKLVAKDGSVVHGRTLEFGTQLESSVAVVPRGYRFTGTTPQGPGLAYTAKYGAVGALLQGNLLLMDGLNEKGLSVGTFYFPGYASYTPINKQNQAKALSPIDFPNWILTQFATVDEVKAALKHVVIAPTVISTWGTVPPPFHYIVYDKMGNSVVIEPLDGGLVYEDNPLGVFTNSPTFDWQMTNLRNFINLRTVNVPPLKIGNLTLAPFGQGSGMVGLPGDFTPPSRFVRAAVFSYTAIPAANADAAILQVFHILNQFDIPVGVAREVTEDTVHTDYTMVTCARDPQALKYYFKTYEDQTIRMINLASFDLNAKAIKQASTSGEQPIVDMSSELK